jgi:hypothetical protein
VNAYALARSRERGDVYGWVALPGDSAQAALLIAEDAHADTFPAAINGIELILKPIPAPQRIS